MKRLENIPKDNIYSVPEGYFDRLPGVIQSRIAEKSVEKRPFFTYAVRYALPILAIGILSLYWIRQIAQPDQPQTAQEILASIDTESLMVYLEESDLTTDDLIDMTDITYEDVEGIEDAVYEMQFSDETLDELLNEYDYEWNNL